MGRRVKKYEKEKWYMCPKRNRPVVPPEVCKKECGEPKQSCEYIERRVKKRVTL